MLFRKKKITPYTPKYYSYNKKDKWFEKHGTTSDWVGIVVGILVAVFTILLFFQTQDSTNAAIRAANAADSTYQLSKRQFDSTIAAGKEAAIDAHKAFIYNNMPILQLANIKYQISNGKDSVRFTADIVDESSSPANVLSSRNSITIYKANYKFKDGDIEYNSNSDYKTIISKGMSFVPIWQKISITKDEYKELINKKSSVYLLGEITYQSPITNVTYVNTYIYEIIISNEMVIRPQKNDLQIVK